ncbi:MULTISPECIES: hypothetical protein [unclassified Chelatococcus]|uniref:hypothetical protein n=1 Tax=unclassified Chelatococcus TaxID=2638111 RepID=UPI0002F27B8A|nr:MULTISPECIES: hypothetical protein [unclassified Chelatococcus]
MPSRRILIPIIFSLSVFSLGAAFAQEPPNAITAPASKTIGTGKPRMEPALIVMNAKGARLEGDKLVLTGISPNAIMFADRPVRAAGHASTSTLLEEWTPDTGSFAKDPPNATVSVLNGREDSVIDAVATLTSPKLDGDTLTFDVAVLEGDLSGGDGPASVFIDIIGLPFTPLSFAGAARRTAFRGAWYAGAAAGAAAAAAPYYHYPPYYRPPCGYYPYPPCY